MSQSVQDKITGLEPPQAKRLRTFCETKRRGRDRVIFDDRMYRELQGIVKDKAYLHEVKSYLDKIGFCQSLYDPNVLQEQVMHFAEPSHPYQGWVKSYKIAKKKMIAEVENRIFKPIRYDSKEMFINALPKEETHAGFIYIETGKRTKVENVDYIWENWNGIIGEALSVGSFNLPILPGTRTQGSGAIGSDGTFTGTWKPKTRLVNMVDLRVIMAETIFARPVQRFMGDSVSWYAGGKDPRRLSSNIDWMTGEYHASVTIDYSKYDQTIPNWLIYDAFEVVKHMFRDMTDHELALFNVVRHDFINKTFIGINGELIQSSRGVPSGSMFTQIIDTIVNKLMIDTYMISHELERYCCLIMGDDNIIACSKEIDLEDLSGYLRHMFGITVNPDKCSTADRWKGQYVEFLSREWRRNGEWRHPGVLISKLLYPECFRDYYRKGFTPKQVLYAYYKTYVLGMDDMCGAYDIGEYFYEVQVDSPPSLKKHFLTGLERYLHDEKMRKDKDALLFVA